MTQARHLLRVLPAIIVLGVAIGVGIATHAQSGRRVPKPAPAPAATPGPTPLPSKPLDKEKSATTFVVGLDRYSSFSTIPLQYYDGVVRGCADQLNNAPGVKADTVHAELTRSDAIKMAKAGKSSYVVLLELKTDSMSSDPSSANKASSLYIEYYVFEALTGKVVTRGNAYQGAGRKGVIVAPPSSSRGNPVYSEYLLKEAAREAADRILNAVKVNMGRPLPRGLTAKFAPLLRITD